MSAAYLDALRTYLGRFSRDFKNNIANIQTADIDAWLRKLETSPRSRNNFRNSIILLFNFAKTAGYLNRDRSTAAEHVAVARKKVEAIAGVGSEIGFVCGDFTIDRVKGGRNVAGRLNFV